MALALNPLFGEIPEQVHLNNSPLISVLGQAIFPKIVKISEEGYIGDFQESIRGDYPHLQRDNIQSVEVNLNQSGMQHQTIETIVWRFFDLERTIRVSLGTDAITLEFSKYVSREEFISRTRSILDALSSTISPVTVIRIGCRYVDRKPVDSFSKFVSVYPLVEINSASISNIERGKAPGLGLIENTPDNLVVDFSRVMSVSKNLLVTWKRTRGCPSESRKREFAMALEQFLGRYAYPDAFNQSFSSFRSATHNKYN